MAVFSPGALRFLLFLFFVLHSPCSFASPEKPSGSSILQLPSHRPTDERKDGGGVDPGSELKSAGAVVCDGDDLKLSCPVSCFRPDPVCGENGVTYWCGCMDARCDNVKVAHVGFCDSHSAGSGRLGLLSGQALLLIHTVWLILVGLSLLIGFQ